MAGGEIDNKFLEININALKQREPTTQLDLDNDGTTFTNFANTVVYPPTTYIPQTIAIFITNNIHLSVIHIFHISRIITLIFNIMLFYLAIKKTPIIKSVFALVGLFPHTLYLMGSNSTDGWIIATIAYFTATLLYAMYNGITKRQLILIAILSTLITLSKTAYLPIILLIFLIPKKYFKTTKLYLSFLSIYFALNIVLLGVWMYLINPIYVTYNVLDATLIDPAQQLLFVIHNPLTFIKLVLIDIMSLGWFHLKNIFGIWYYGLNSLITLVYSIITFTTIIFDKTPNRTIKLSSRTIVATIIFIELFFIELLIYLSWNPLHATFIKGIQGRYFLPLVIPTALLLYNDIVNIKLTKKLFQTLITLIGLPLVLIYIAKMIYMFY